MPDKNVFVIQVPGYADFQPEPIIMLGEPDERYLPYVTYTGKVTWTEVERPSAPVFTDEHLPLDTD